MKKLKRYKSFEELKFEFSSVTETDNRDKQQEQALEDFFNLLRTKLLRKQQNEENNLLYGQQLSR